MTTDPAPGEEDYRPHYERREVRACDLEGGDVIWHEDTWRFVPNVYYTRSLEDLDALGLNENERATLVKYLTTPKQYVVAEIQHENPEHRSVTLVPIRFYDLVTIQAETGKILCP